MLALACPATQPVVYVGRQHTGTSIILALACPASQPVVCVCRQHSGTSVSCYTTSGVCLSPARRRAGASGATVDVKAAGGRETTSFTKRCRRGNAPSPLLPSRGQPLLRHMVLTERRLGTTGPVDRGVGGEFSTRLSLCVSKCRREHQFEKPNRSLKKNEECVCVLMPLDEYCVRALSQTPQRVEGRTSCRTGWKAWPAGQELQKNLQTLKIEPSTSRSVAKNFDPKIPEAALMKEGVGGGRKVPYRISTDHDLGVPSHHLRPHPRNVMSSYMTVFIDDGPRELDSVVPVATSGCLARCGLVPRSSSKSGDNCHPLGTPLVLLATTFTLLAHHWSSWRQLLPSWRATGPAGDNFHPLGAPLVLLAGDNFHPLGAPLVLLATTFTRLLHHWSCWRQLSPAWRATGTAGDNFHPLGASLVQLATTFTLLARHWSFW
uniref:Uncharacterized protein n=1 Tax=Timema monikensis TaxID=170555 RepID=A0A7R9HPT6_9NEOP|nr:unnamed protein product [Timema monikensis]